jgi:hypothetical protein
MNEPLVLERRLGLHDRCLWINSLCARSIGRNSCRL